MLPWTTSGFSTTLPSILLSRQQNPTHLPRLDSDLKLSENQRDLPTTWLVNIKDLASGGYTSEYQAHYITTYIDCRQKWKRILSLFSIHHNGLKTFLKDCLTLFTPLNFKQVYYTVCLMYQRLSNFGFYVHSNQNSTFCSFFF